MLRKLVDGKIAIGRLNAGRLLQGAVYEAIEAGVVADTNNSLTRGRR